MIFTPNYFSVGLALDYIGKAAKINEAVYGKNDNTSRQSYEKFSYIYAEAGKLQYNDALIRFQRKQSSSKTVPDRPQPEEVYSPEQSLTQKIFSLTLLLIFFVIIVIEVTLVILSFSKGYLYIPSTEEAFNFFRYLWLKIFGPGEL